MVGYIIGGIVVVGLVALGFGVVWFIKRHKQITAKAGKVIKKADEAVNKVDSAVTSAEETAKNVIDEIKK